MNKYQEAMNYLWNLYDENKIYGIASRGYLEIIQESVEKATPKKLVATKRTRRCPSCNRQMSDINNAHPKMKFCQNCGQALDWEDKKENVDNQELNEDYIVLSDTPKVTFEDVKKKYHFENGEVKENEYYK